MPDTATPPTLYEWKALVIIPKTELGLWTYVVGEDVDAAAENAEILTGGELVMLEAVDPRWTQGQTLAQRVAA